MLQEHVEQRRVRGLARRVEVGEAQTVPSAALGPRVAGRVEHRRQRRLEHPLDRPDHDLAERPQLTLDFAARAQLPRRRDAEHARRHAVRRHDQIAKMDLDVFQHQVLHVQIQLLETDLDPVVLVLDEQDLAGVLDAGRALPDEVFERRPAGLAQATAFDHDGQVRHHRVLEQPRVELQHRPVEAHRRERPDPAGHPVVVARRVVLLDVHDLVARAAHGPAAQTVTELRERLLFRRLDLEVAPALHADAHRPSGHVVEFGDATAAVADDFEEAVAGRVVVHQQPVQHRVERHHAVVGARPQQQRDGRVVPVALAGRRVPHGLAVAREPPPEPGDELALDDAASPVPRVPVEEREQVGRADPRLDPATAAPVVVDLSRRLAHVLARRGLGLGHAHGQRARVEQVAAVGHDGHGRAGVAHRWHPRSIRFAFSRVISST